MNFLLETIRDVEQSGHVPKDIIHIGNHKYGCTWEEFTELADFEYDNGFGGQEIASDLKIFFKDGTYMWRGEYDGSEWWNYCRPYNLPKEYKKIESLKKEGSWENLEKIHE